MIDEKGKLIAKGRDLPELKARCRVETHRPVKQQKGEFKDFPENFTFEASHKVTGVVVKQYQALVPTKALLTSKLKMSQALLFRRLMIKLRRLNSIAKGLFV